MAIRTVVGIAALIAVLAVLALRPVFANPATTAVLDGGLTRFDLLILLSLVVPAVALFALRVLAYTRDSEDQSDWQRPEQQQREPSPPESRQMVTDRRDTDERDGDDADSDERDDDDTNSDDGDPNSAERDSDGSSDDGNTDATAILGGQGGARDSDFDIEDEPPDAPLSDHFEYLDDQLDETDERPAIEELDPEALDENPVPDRCPQAYCDAIWTERTVLGFGGERYERLDDDRVRCLECEQVYSLRESDS